MALQIKLLSPELLGPLYILFKKIKTSDDINFFHPHEFSFDKASEICYNRGKDLYYVVVNNKDITAYGLLRGWEEGYDIPILGIYVNPDYRKLGIGKMFMNFLHVAAKSNKAKSIKLKVYKSNEKAVNLYKSIGYNLTDYDEEQYIGELIL